MTDRSEDFDKLDLWEWEFADEMLKKSVAYDPTKPCMVDADGFVKPNEEFGRRINALEPENFGTSFFVNFVPGLGLENVRGQPEGNQVLNEIIRQFSERCAEVLGETLQKHKIGLAKKNVETLLHIDEKSPASPGEIYYWIPGLHVEEEIAFEIMKRIRQTFREEPIKIIYHNEKYDIPFYGTGVRSFSF
jgi:hypothetical protein